MTALREQGIHLPLTVPPTARKNSSPTGIADPWRQQSNSFSTIALPLFESVY